jgi:MFS family permease
MSIPPKAQMPLLLATIFLVALLEFLQANMVVFAAAPLTAQISASPEEYSLVTVLYASVAVLSTSQLTALVQKLGWRNYMLATLAVFASGAWLCGSSHELYSFALGRMLMGAGGGVFFTAARMMVNLIPPSPQRIKGIAALVGGLAIGLAVSPSLAGTAVVGDQWQAIFGLLVGIAALAAALVCVRLPVDAAAMAASPSRTSLLGAVALLVGTFCALYALARSIFDFYSNPAGVLAWFVVGLAALALFVYHQGSAAQPFLLLRQLGSKRYVLGVTVFTVGYTVLGASNAMLPVFIQRGFGVALDVAGRAQTLGFMGAVFGWIVFVLIARTHPGAKKFYLTGYASLCLCGWFMSQLTPQANLWTDVVPLLFLFGAFVTFTMPTTALHSFRDFQHNEVVFSNAQQLKNMLSQVGFGLGSAVANVAFQARLSQHFSVLGERIVTGGAELNAQLEQLGAAFAGAANPGALALAQLSQQLNQQSVMLGAFDYFWVLMWIGIVGMVTMALQRVFK